MRPSRLLAIAVTALPVVVAIEGLAACGQTCYNDLVAKGSSIGCPGGEAACLCNSQDFRDGVDSCVNQLCPGQGEDPVVQLNLIHSSCAPLQSQAPVEAVPTPTSEPSSASELPVSATLDPATSAIASPGSQIDSPSPSPSLGTELTPTESAIPTSPTSAGSDATPKPSVSETNASPSGTDAAGKEPLSNSDEVNDSDDTSSTGLPVTAKVGIGIGVSAGVLLTILALFLVMRRRRYTPRGGKISDPLPSSGRDFGAEAPRFPPAFSEKNASELEMTSRKYEDMLPRQQPRQMV